VHHTSTSELLAKTTELQSGLADLVPKLKERLEQEAKEKAKAEAEAAAAAALNASPTMDRGEVHGLKKNSLFFFF
jgi:hypothetical protein